MLTKKLNIIPVKLEPTFDTVEPPKVVPPEAVCVIKALDMEIAFYAGVEMDIVQAIMKELNIREA